jgi:chromosome segregation ATPase
MGLDIRKEVLKLLKEDEEFRYTVAGLIGIEDLRRGQEELKIAIAKLEGAVAELQVAVARLQEAVANLQEAVANLAREQRRMSRVLRYLTRYVEEVSITLEEEGLSIIERRLRQRGIVVKLRMLVKPYIEMDIYGSNGSLTIVGETKTRLTPRHLKLLEKKIEKIKMNEPELLKGMVVKTIYAMWVHPEAYEECIAKSIWLNTPDRELIELEQILSKL